MLVEFLTSEILETVVRAKESQVRDNTDMISTAACCCDNFFRVGSENSPAIKLRPLTRLEITDSFFDKQNCACKVR